jgi:serine O-acetyltransferase
MLARLRKDIQAVKERDPACTSTLSALTHYPGLKALRWHRRTHWLHSHGMVFIARSISQSVRHRTGIEIHPAATIGEGLFIDHGMGVVIGETSVIRDNVTLYQGVTLGGTGKERGKRHPTIEDNVVIGVGAAVLGDITIGRGTRVGAGAVVVNDVPPNCTVVGIPGRIVVREGQRVETVDLHHEDLPDPVVEMFRCLQRRIDRLDGRLTVEEAATGEGAPKPANLPGECVPGTRDDRDRIEDPATDPPTVSGRSGVDTTREGTP